MCHLRPDHAPVVNDDTSYQCQHCGVWYVVRCLARDCEAKHAKEPR